MSGILFSIHINKKPLCYVLIFFTIFLVSNYYNNVIATYAQMIGSLSIKDRVKASSFDMKGVSLYLSGEYSNAIDYFDKAINIFPNPVFLNNKGSALYQMGKYQESITDFDKAISIEPNNILSLISKGNSLYQLENYTATLNYYDKVLTLDKYNSAASFNKNLTMNKIRNILQINNTTELIDPVLTHNILLNGLAYAVSEDPKDVKKSNSIYDEALTIDPNDKTAWLYKSYYLYGKGDYTGSLALVEKTLKIDPTDKDGKEQKDLIISKLNSNP